jgi:predicted RNA-binding Zn-ribbon protein involved in translation (DUF1610 family)
MVPCPKCKTKIKVESDERPIKIECPNCGAKGTIKGKKEEKETKEKEKEDEEEKGLEDAKVIEHEPPEKEKVITVDEEGKDDVYHEPTKKLWEPSEGELPLEGAVVEAPVEEEMEKKPPVKEEKKEKKPPVEEEKKKKKKPTKPEEEPKKKPPAKEEKKKKATKIKCKNCGGTIIIKSSKRPLKIKCLKCGKKGTLKN